MLSKSKNLWWRSFAPSSSSSLRFISSPPQFQNQPPPAGKFPSSQSSKPSSSSSSSSAHDEGTLRSPEPSSSEMKKELHVAMEKGERGQLPQSQLETPSKEAEKGERERGGEGWWSGSGFSSTSSSSEGRGDIKERNDVREGRSQAKGVTGGEMREAGRMERSQGFGMGMSQGCGLDPKKGEQSAGRRTYSTQPSGKGTDIPEMSPFVTLDRGPGMTGKDSFAFDERGKQVKVDSGTYGSRDFGKEPGQGEGEKGEERVAAAAADSYPSDSKKRPPEKENSSTPGEAEFPSRQPEEGSQHLGKDYSGTPPKDLSSSMKQGLDEAERLKAKAKASASQSPIKQAGKGERMSEARTEGTRGKDPLPTQSPPIVNILSNIGSSLKEGWRTLMGNNQGNSQRPRYP